MRYCLILALILSACSTERQAIKSASNILKDIDQGQTIERSNLLLGQLNQAISNANLTVLALNQKLPPLLDRLNQVSDQSLLSLQNFNIVSSNLSLGLQTWNSVGLNSVDVLTNVSHVVKTWDAVGDNIARTSTNIDSLIGTVQKVGVDADNTIILVNKNLLDNNSNWWIKKVITSSEKYWVIGAIVATLLIGISIWAKFFRKK